MRLFLLALAALASSALVHAQNPPPPPAVVIPGYTSSYVVVFIGLVADRENGKRERERERSDLRRESLPST